MNYSSVTSNCRSSGMMTKPNPTASKPVVVTESITKTTFTETTVKRVTSTAVIEEVSLRRSGGPLGLSIIGGSDHSCVPFGTGEQVKFQLTMITIMGCYLVPNDYQPFYI